MPGGDLKVALSEDPFSATCLCSAAGKGWVKILWWDGDACVCSPSTRARQVRVAAATSGTISLSPAQLAMLIEGIDWRRVERTQRPELVV